MRLPRYLLAAAVLAAPAAASDLALDGQTQATVTLGSSFTAVLSGAPGLPAVILLDVSPGPTPLFGESVPLGFTPVMFTLGGGLTNVAGNFNVPVNVPSAPGLAGVMVFGAGLVLDANEPNGLDWSNGVSLTLAAPPVAAVPVELAGVPRAGHPHFSWVSVIRDRDPVHVGIDPDAHPALVGKTVDIYVTAKRTAAEWDLDPTLTDVTANGVETVVISGAGLAANRFEVDTGLLPADVGASLGLGYDVIVDVDQDGQLSAGDLIDGYGDLAGFYVCRDPGLPGPYGVTQALYSGGTMLAQKLYYPSNVAELSDLPLVIVSHGNGHNYQWYDHFGMHLGSYGYVVMSHQNNTVPGVLTASTTTLTNTDYFLGNLDTIVGGALLGKVDKSRMAWIGHSRGGEGVAIAYDRIVDGTWVPVHYTLEDIKLISSMAPTDFLGTGTSTPHDANYHLWVAGADSDVTGCANNDIARSYHLLGRATEQRQSITLYGAGHGDLHAGTGGAFATGPCLIGKPTTHLIMRGYLLPLVEYHLRGNPAAKDWLVRQYPDLHPKTVPVGTNPCVVVTNQFREGSAAGKLVIDDFDGTATTTVASSGAAISSTTGLHVVGLLDDPDTVFTANLGQPFNGMTYARATDNERGAVVRFDSGSDEFLRYDLIPEQQDWTGFGSLSVRVCQSTRHPLTVAEIGSADFSVRITDGDGVSSAIRVGNLLQGIEEPYQRGGCGIGLGWGNEFETVRITLQQFKVGAPALDLGDIASVELLFGPSWGSPMGFFGIDDLELNVD